MSTKKPFQRTVPPFNVGSDSNVQCSLHIAPFSAVERRFMFFPVVLFSFKVNIEEWGLISDLFKDHKTKEKIDITIWLVEVQNYTYRLFFLRLIAQFFTQIYMNCFVSS